jgi:hypothetical protein
MTVDNRYYLDRLDDGSLRASLGSELDQIQTDLDQAEADIVVLQGSSGGGSSNELALDWQILVETVAGTYTIVDENSNPVTLPAGTIVEKVIVDVIHNGSADIDGDLSFNLQSAADLYTAPSIIALTNGIKAGIPNDVVTNMIKLTATRTFTVTIGADSMFASHIRLFVRYVQSSAT